MHNLGEVATPRRSTGEDAANLQSISGPTVKAFLAGAIKQQINVDEILRRSGIELGANGELPGHIAVSQWARVMENLRLALNDEAVGLLARPLLPGTFMMICRGIVHSGSIGEAMTRFAHFYTLLAAGLEFEFSEDGGAEIRIRGHAEQWPTGNIMTEYSLFGFHRLFSWLAGEAIEPHQVMLCGAPPQHIGVYPSVYLDAPIHFKQNCFGLKFSDSYLNLPITRSEAEVEEFAKNFTVAILSSLERKGKFSVQVRSFLLENLKRYQPMPTAEETAAHFGCSLQTFCRHLRHEGLRFQDVKAHTRRNLAMYFLGRTTISMEDVAEHVGYSEASAFIRAFKAWTDMTPLAYRRTMGSA